MPRINSKPLVLVVALLAVVGVTGTAYAVSPSHTSKAKSHSDRGGHKGHKGGKSEKGAEYGVATVNVSRGGKPATAWATYSTRLGSPVGDTTSGVFRFTCATANAPCTVSVKAAVLSESHGTANVYPRVLIYRQDYDNGGPEVYCEYGDGSTGSAPARARQAGALGDARVHRGPAQHRRLRRLRPGRPGR